MTQSKHTTHGAGVRLVGVYGSLSLSDPGEPAGCDRVALLAPPSSQGLSAPPSTSFEEAAVQESSFEEAAVQEGTSTSRLFHCLPCSLSCGLAAILYSTFTTTRLLRPLHPLRTFKKSCRPPSSPFNPKPHCPQPGPPQRSLLLRRASFGRACASCRHTP